MIFNESQTDIPFQAMQALLLNCKIAFCLLIIALNLKKKSKL